MKNRLIKLEKNLSPNSSATHKSAAVAIVHDDGKVFCQGQYYTSEETFRYHCHKNGIQTVLFLPTNGRDAGT